MPVGSFWHFTNKRAGTLILNQSVRESNIFINESFRNMYAFFYKLWHNQTNLLNLKKVIRTCKKPIFYPILTFILMSFIKYITLVLYYGHSTLRQKKIKMKRLTLSGLCGDSHLGLWCLYCLFTSWTGPIVSYWSGFE